MCKLVYVCLFVWTRMPVCVCVCAPKYVQLLSWVGVRVKNMYTCACLCVHVCLCVYVCVHLNAFGYLVGWVCV